MVEQTPIYLDIDKSSALEIEASPVDLSYSEPTSLSPLNIYMTLISMFLYIQYILFPVRKI
jgi:hypothetical protein